MGDQLISSVVTVATAIIGLAIIAVLVSKNANTSRVISAGAGGLATGIQAAVSPITGSGGLNMAGTSSYSGTMY